MELSVRKAVTGDARRIRDVHLASIEGLAGQSYTQNQVAAWAHERDPEDYPIEFDDTRFLVAEADEEVIGFGWMKPEASAYFQTDVEGEITAIYVHPSVARHGVGSRLYAELEERAIREDVNSMGLWASRNAVKFYAAKGYEQVTEHVHEYRDGVELTLVEMEKRAIQERA
jgi:putative acetyltransferase